MANHYTYREKEASDDAWITKVATTLWGSVDIISKDHVYKLTHIPTLIAVADNTPVGWISYARQNDTMEIVALYSSIPHQGIGTTLVSKVCEEAKTQGCHTIWVLTTNDNTHALRFYQKRGFVFTAVRFNELAKQRERKPIPMTGNDGIPIRDEIELTKTL